MNMQARTQRSEGIRLLADGFRKVREVIEDVYPDMPRATREPAAAAPRSKSNRDIGNLLIKVAKASDPVSKSDFGLTRGASEGVPSDGGFLVGPQHSEQLLFPIYNQTSVFAPLVDRRETDNPIAEVKIPGIDESSRADGLQWGGMTVYWEAESAQLPATLPREKMIEFSGKKMIAQVRASRELLNDAPILGSVVSKGFAAVGGFKLDAAILAGTGAGVPLGILNSPALISVAKQSGQSAATIVGENVANMWSRFPVPCRRRGMWFCNEDAEAQLETLAGASGLALYMPAGTGGNPYPLLKGRPLIALEQCPALGAVGDIVLADLSQYVLIDNGVKSALSVHARFDTDEVVFRFVWRVDGKSAYSTPITPYNGSSTRSPFVCVAAR
jgi:HK97 family phage major capsid protein